MRHELRDRHQADQQMTVAIIISRMLKPLLPVAKLL